MQSLAVRLLASGLNHISRHQAMLANLSSKLDALSPLATLRRGFAIVSDAKSGRILVSSKDVVHGKKILARLSAGSLVAEVISKEDAP